MAGIDFLAQSLRNPLSVSEVMWSCNEAKRDLRRARRKCQQQAKMNLWHELESLRQYTWHLEWVIHNLEQQLAQSQGADSESEQSLARALASGLSTLTGAVRTPLTKRKRSWDLRCGQKKKARRTC